ncbi:hypothetical protein E1B28_010205 [Marasmius oreades]|uniref:Uncharacterized protein n=1 Tax=Marasmius oreades TaxID=181124 RepID=A0A9P7RWT2_9AGAR|nr:uncharacterized protein E1B28_010205 [Marasmius oreades]KAG7091152.1 hypothetical protein E1B28_010205 [Marasmius oreades]
MAPISVPKTIIPTFDVNSYWEGFCRAVSLVTFLAPIILIHVYCVEPTGFNGPQCYVCEIVFLLINVYGIGWGKRNQPYIALYSQTIALYLLMIILRLEEEKDLSLAFILLLPPITSVITLSSALYLVHGTLETYLLPFDSDLQVVHWLEVRSFFGSKRKAGELTSEPNDRDIEAAIVSLAEDKRKAT